MEDNVLPSAPSNNSEPNSAEAESVTLPKESQLHKNDASFSASGITFAKIVATPTLFAWSQAYNAGKLFAVLSLKRKEMENQEDLLPPLGKEIFATLEEEYFTLEEKNLPTIKQAVLTTCKKIPKDVSASFVVTSIIDNIMYVFVLGNGKAILKRKDKVGIILDAKETYSDSLQFAAASGLLESNDIVILETEEFNNIITTDLLYKALEHEIPTDIAETLTPKIHERQEGGAAAFVLHIAHALKEEQEETLNEEESTPLVSFPNLSLNLTFFKKIFVPPQNLTHRKRMFVSLAGILIIILAASIFLGLKKQEEAKTNSRYLEVSQKAQKKYDEGIALLSLNKDLSRSDLLEAKKIVDGAKPQFKQGSIQEKSLKNLSVQIETALATAQNINLVVPLEVSSDKSALLSYEQKNGADSYYAQDSKNIYTIDATGVNSIDKATEKSKRIIQNKSYWSDPAGLGTYLTNVYVLDKKANQALKFVSLEDGYSKTNYLKNTANVDFSNAKGMAVDTSVWILFSDGGIKKFTRGSQDSFSISGLEESLKNPTKIFTNTDTKNVYILDKGNNRIVVLGKEGAYLAQYQADILSNAQDFDIQETAKKIFILSSGKIWEIPIK